MSEQVSITVVESPPYGGVPAPRHLYLVAPVPAGGDESAVQQVLPWQPRSERPAMTPIPELRTRLLLHADPASDRLHGAPRDPDDDVDPEFGRRLCGRSELPDPLAWTARFSQAALEIIAGRRSPSQMMRWTNRSVYAQLNFRSGAISGRVTIKRIRICEPADGIVEATVVTMFNDRAHALALRFEGLDGRWLCTALTGQFSAK